MGYSTLHRPQGAALDTGAWCRCPPLCSPAGCRCLPALAAGRGLVHSAPAGRMPLCHARAPWGLEVGICRRKRKLLQAESRWQLPQKRGWEGDILVPSYPPRLSEFPPALHAPPLLLQFAALRPVRCPAHPSLFILAHTKLAAHMFVHLFCLCFFKLCKGN